MAKPASGTALDTGNALYTGLTNAWGLLEGTGTTCTDSKGGNTATISGGVTWTTDGDGPLLVGDGVTGKALLASLIDLIPGFASTGSWTIAWRATCTGAVGHQSAMGYATYGYHEFMSTGASLDVHCQGNHQFTGLTSFTSLDDYMVVAESRTVLKLYHNGTLVDTATGCDTWNSIGAFCGEESTYFFEGTFSYLYIWVGTALTSGDAATLAADPYALFATAGDTTPPVVANANVNAAGTTLTINFTETGSSPVLPASSVTGFTLKAGGVSTGTLTSTAISGTAYTATTGRTILASETLTLDYAPGNVTDSASPTPNDLVTFSGTSVTNNSTQVAAATSYALSGPSSGALNVASANFTVTPNGNTSGTVTPATDGSGIFTPSSLTWTANAVAKTFTYTPTTVVGSPHDISITSSPALSYSGSPISYTVGADAHDYTSQQDGDWNVPSDDPDSPWYDGGTQSGWASVPSSADDDTATIEHDVTATSDISVGDGTASTVLTCATGTLTVTGCSLTIRGNAEIGSYDSGNVVNRLSVLSSGGASASLLLDGNSGVTPTVTMTYDTQITFTGSAAHRVTVRTKNGTAGDPGFFASAIAARVFFLDAAYVDFSHLGTATQAALVVTDASDATTPANPPWLMDHCTIDNCGRLPHLQVPGGTVNCQITYCVWSNPLETEGRPLQIAITNALTTGTRLFQHNVLPEETGLAFFDRSQDLLIDDCFFGSMIWGSNVGSVWADLSNCFLYQSTDYAGGDTSEISGNVTNCFALQGLAGNINALTLCLCQPPGSIWSGNVFQSARTTEDRGTFIVGMGEEGDTDHTNTLHHNLVLPTFGGDLSGYLCVQHHNGAQDFVTEIIVEHNTQFLGPNTSFIGDSGVPGCCLEMIMVGALGMRVDEVLSFRSNLIVRAGAAPGGGTAIDVTAVAAKYVDGPVLDALNADNADYNAYTALDPVPSGWWTGGGSGNNIVGAGGEEGSVYNTPMSGTPGTHDVNLGEAASLSANGPQFVDPSRGLLQFDTYMGGDGTLSHALASLKAQYDPTNPDYISGYTNAALVTWIKAGWAPTNLALHNTAHDGTDIGAISVAVPTVSFVLSPGRTTQAGGSISVTATGDGTLWTGETEATLFSVSGGSSPSISSTDVLSDTLATFTLAPGSAPAALVITDTSTSADVTFLVTGTGTHEDIGSTFMSPASGPSPALAAGFAGVPGGYWAAFMRDVSGDDVSPYNAAWQALAADTQGPTIRTGFYGSEPDATGTAYGNMAVGNPINQIPGNTPLQAVVIWEYAADSDPGPIPLWPAMSIEGWPFGSNNSDNYINGFVGITNGSASVTGSGTNFTNLVPGDRICFAVYGAASPPAPTFYTVAAVADDTHLTLTATYGETSHATGDGWELYGPFNRPPTYDWQSEVAGDSRALILVRDEGTGQPTDLWELYKPSYDPGVTGWKSGATAHWDLTTGDQRKDGMTSDCAGGTPAMPMLVRWEEANSGTISHPLRCAVAAGLGSLNKCIWPATHAASASAVDFTAGTVPLGSVIRLNATWLASNRASFPDIIKPVLDAAATYGLHVNDYTSGAPFEIDWTQDSRWNKADILTLWAIPVTAFELVDSIKPQYTLSISAAPYTTGNAITFTIAYVGDTQYGNANTNFDLVRVYVQSSTDGGDTWVTGNHVDLTTSSRSGTCQFTPGSGGNYLFRAYQASGVYWLPGAFISAAVATSARALSTIQDGRWDDPATWGETPPAYGDTASIFHDITMIGDAVIGNGGGTALTCSVGTLLVVGCTLTVRGTISGAGASAVDSAGNDGAIVIEGGGSPATAYTLSGPSSGTVSIASTNFTVTPNGTTSGTVTLNTGGSGSFSPSSLTWTGDSVAKTFTYTPVSTSGSPHSISITSSPVLTYAGSPIAYTVSPAAATSYTLSGPSTGAINVASTNFTVTPVGGTYSGSIALHSSGSGTFTPSSLTFSGGSSAQTFTYTPTSIVGSPHAISTTATPTLGTNPAPVSYTVSSVLTMGVAVRDSQGNTVALIEVSVATGGTPPYTYQWYRSTSDGFTPGGGNIVSGATNRVLSDTGLSNATTYYYVCVVTDGVAATANSNQVSATPTASTARTLYWRWGAMLTPQWMLEGYKR